MIIIPKSKNFGDKTHSYKLWISASTIDYKQFITVT